VKINKTAIQTFSSFTWGSRRKTARILEAISQDFRRSPEGRKIRTKHATPIQSLINTNACTISHSSLYYS